MFRAVPSISEIGSRLGKCVNTVCPCGISDSRFRFNVNLMFQCPPAPCSLCWSFDAEGIHTLEAGTCIVFLPDDCYKKGPRSW